MKPARRILYVQYANSGAYPPLHHSAHILAASDWHVLVLAIEDTATHALDFPQHPNITYKALAFVRLGWQRAFYFLFFMLWVLYWTARWRPQWVYASDLFATPAAWFASFFPSLRVLYHEHDTPHATRRLARWCMLARARLAKRAIICVLPNATRAETFAREFDTAAKTFCVWNCPERAKVASLLNTRTSASFVLLYQGSITPWRLPLTILDALAQLPDAIRLHIIGYETVGHVGYRESFCERARKLNVASRVEFFSAMPRAALLAQARACDVGLALTPLHSADVNETTMLGASNKPFDYLACGLDLIVSDAEDWRAVFVETGFARACNPNDAASIADAMRWYWERRTERAVRAQRAQQKILDAWNYETQFAPVLERLARDFK